MTTESKEINSGDTLDDIEKSFRVIAGPGAGKTYWLTRHISNVVRHSSRLGPTQRVACISFTNVAVEEMREELSYLGVRESNVDVTTIHSFLYRNILRPYAWTLNEDNCGFSVNHREIDGHTEHEPTVGSLKNWFQEVDREVRKIWGNKDDWLPYLRRVQWQKSDSDDWQLTKPNQKWVPDYLPTTDLDKYKLPFWRRGEIHHSDVLFLADTILRHHPELYDFISARYPYIYADEFQDTQPVQAELLSNLHSRGSVVGVIGDPEQAIYGFRGGDPTVLKDLQDHSNFGISDAESLQIPGNRRSTQQLTDVLNGLRKDELQQEPLRNIEGTPPTCLIGKKSDVLNRAEAEISDGELAILAYTNDTVAELRTISENHTQPSTGTWETFREMDSNDDRRRLLRQAFRALRLINTNSDDIRDAGIAIRELKRGLRLRNGSFGDAFTSTDAPISSLDRRGLAANLLFELTSNFDRLKTYAVKSVWNDFLSEVVETFFNGALRLSHYRSGNSNDFAESHSLNDLYQTVSTSNETHRIRTIHKAKGAEFNHVLVWFDDATDLQDTLSPDVHNEDTRTYYVAMSRARDSLILGLPDSDGVEDALAHTQIDVSYIPDSNRPNLDEQ